LGERNLVCEWLVVRILFAFFFLLLPTPLDKRAQVISTLGT
jgi:hypothetical protein